MPTFATRLNASSYVAARFDEFVGSTVDRWDYLGDADARGRGRGRARRARRERVVAARDRVRPVRLRRPGRQPRRDVDVDDREPRVRRRRRRRRRRQRRRRARLDARVGRLGRHGRQLPRQPAQPRRGALAPPQRLGARVDALVDRRDRERLRVRARRGQVLPAALGRGDGCPTGATSSSSSSGDDRAGCEADDVARAARCSSRARCGRPTGDARAGTAKLVWQFACRSSSASMRPHGRRGRRRASLKAALSRDAFNWVAWRHGRAPRRRRQPSSASATPSRSQRAWRPARRHAPLRGRASAGARRCARMMTVPRGRRRRAASATAGTRAPWEAIGGRARRAPCRGSARARTLCARLVRGRVPSKQRRAHTARCRRRSTSPIPTHDRTRHDPRSPVARLMASDASCDAIALSYWPGGRPAEVAALALPQCEHGRPRAASTGRDRAHTIVRPGVVAQKPNAHAHRLQGDASPGADAGSRSARAARRLWSRPDAARTRAAAGRRERRASRAAAA